MSTTPVTRGSWQRPDLVPLGQRLRYLRRYRVAAVAVTLVLQLLGVAAGSVVQVAAIGAVAVVLGLVADLVVGRRGNELGRGVFGVVLLGDAVLFTVLTHLAGGMASPVRHVIVLHLVVVTLVASHRSGTKLAIWHSLLLLVVHEAVDVGFLTAPEMPTRGTELAVHLGLVWVVTLATASASAVNEREILRRRYDLDALARMSRALDEVTDVHDVAGVLVDHVVETFDARRAAVVSVRDDDPISLAGHGLAPVVTAGAVSGVLATVCRQRSTQLQAGLGADDDWLAAQLPGVGRVLLVPLATGDEVDGVLVVEFPDAVGERLERRIVTTVERFAAQGALALDNARLHRELVAMAETDGLTGVANRAAFDRQLAVELARVDRQGGQFLLLLCDIDHFKTVNDTHGHTAGDAVLTEVAQALRAQARPYDVVARFGGEEFAVLLPTTPDVPAARIAERFRAAVANAPTTVPVTVSVGVVSVEAPVAPVLVVEAADRALYASKRGGRDRVTEAVAIRPVLRTG